MNKEEKIVAAFYQTSDDLTKEVVSTHYTHY
jgi:hypothetical protein